MTSFSVDAPLIIDHDAATPDEPQLNALPEGSDELRTQSLDAVKSVKSSEHPHQLPAIRQSTAPTIRATHLPSVKSERSTAVVPYSPSGPLGDLDAFLRAAERAPMLTADEEKTLALKLRDQNDLEAAQKLVLSHLRLVISIARGFLGYGLPYADLIQEGNIGLMKAICTLLSFIVILWNLSGPFAVSILGKEISIPGYMVWVAICYAGLGTFLIHKVGHRLVNLNFVQQRYEADFRFSMMRLRENAESVAFYHGEPHEKSVFLERFRVLLENFWKIVKKQKQLVWLNSGYSQIAIIFPFVVAIPRYLRRELTLGGLMQG